MASLSISGDNASYTLTLSGMSTSRRYHVFVQDLNSDGSGNGYYCRRSSVGASSSWTYSGSNSSPYSSYQRHVIVYETTSATPFNVGSHYTVSEIYAGLPSGYSTVASEYIQAAASASYKVKIVLGTGVSGGRYIRNGSSGTGTAFSGDLTVDVGPGGYVYLTDVYYSSGYTYPVAASPSSGSGWTVIDASGSWSDHYVSAPSSSGTRTVTLTASVAPTTYYYRYRYIVESTGAILETSSLYSATSTVGYITVTLSAIPEPSSSSYVKSGSYYAVAHCSVDAASNYARCTGTSTSDPSIIGVYVHPTTKAYYYMLRYLTPSGGTLSESSIYAKSAAYSSTSTPVTLSDLPGPGLAGWEKTGNYSAVAHCSIVSAYGYATITSTNTSDPSIIGVYCKQATIAPFYWDGDDGTGDAAIIATGLPVRNITAARWNRLKAKIAEVATAQGSSWSYSPVSSGDAITAGTASAPGEYRIVRSGISSLTGHGSLPALRSAGDRIIASDFRGAGSLQSALNTAITLQNNQ